MIAATFHGWVVAVLVTAGQETGFVPEAVSNAVREATPKSMRVEVIKYRPFASPSCVPFRAELKGGVRAGILAVRLFGNAEQPECSGWAWVHVAIHASVWVATRPIRAGESLANATQRVERELTQSQVPLQVIPENAVASRALAVGVMVEERHVRTPGPTPGQTVVVVVKTGSLWVEQNARVVPCPQGRACALLNSGKRVEGVWAEDRIIVELL